MLQNLREVSEIGLYDKTTDLWFDLVSYSRCGTLDKINLFFNKEKQSILGIELFYGGIGTGIFKGKSALVDPNNKKEIPVLKENPILKIKGVFDKGKIYKLTFVFKDGSENGFCVDNINAIKKEECIIPNERNEPVASFIVSFSKELTSIIPTYQRNEKISYNEALKIYSTEVFGKHFNDSIGFKISEDILASDSKVISITAYQDSKLLMGVEIKYSLNGSEKTTSFGKKTSLKDTLTLSEGEEIEDITVRSGDLIDGILIKTNKNNMLISGGNGGGPHFFRSSECVENKKLSFVGFEGEFGWSIQNLKVIFK